jgi:hypothetical protein
MNKHCYIVDVSALDSNQRRALFKELDDLSFMTYVSERDRDRFIVINGPDKLASLVNIPENCILQDVTGWDLSAL